MITSCEIIQQPNSGDFEERIYDHQSSWNSSSWTYVKFEDSHDGTWCGVFRGQGRNAVLSSEKNEILVLTSDCLWRIAQQDGKLLEEESHPSYCSLTVAPNGEFILADYYEITRISTTIRNKVLIESPIKMDKIEFGDWIGSKLQIRCYEFMNWGKEVRLELDAASWKIKQR